MARKSGGRSGDLFIDKSGQLRITEKSAEQQAMENRAVECLGQAFKTDEARRAYFLETLREKLTDPEFKKTPGFPIGTDEDILRLSDPPYYTACPNPFLRDFVRSYRGADRLDNTHGPFVGDVTEGKTEHYYNVHTYHTKVPYRAIARFVLHYTRPGDVILDAFSGTGMTGLAAQACESQAFVRELDPDCPEERIGKRATVLVDLSPAATHIAANYTGHTEPEVFERECDAILSDFRAQCGWMFTTTDPKSGAECPVDYYVWSSVFGCPDCGHEIVFWDEGVDQETGHKSSNAELVCPSCKAANHRNKFTRVEETYFDDLLGTTAKRQKEKLILVAYRSKGKKSLTKEPDAADHAVLERVNCEPVADPVPLIKMMRASARLDKDRKVLEMLPHEVPNAIACAGMDPELLNERTSFRRIIGFLDADALPAGDAVTRELVAPYVIRTEKRRAIDAQGNPLFKPRHTQLTAVSWGPSHHEQRALYDAVTEYVRDGYNRAMREKQTAVGFLMILMQRLITSSTAAIRTAMERRLDVLELPSGQLSLFPEDIAEEWSALDAQDQLDTVLKARLKGLKDERKEVELLLSAARRCEAQGPDVKALALLEAIQRLQREENDPQLKVLVFTEFIPTQAMLADFLGQRGFSVACLNGSLNLDERRDVQHRFASDAQILVSTDAGGEGLNLQFCHVVVNYDLPWNPMKIEQRIGRVDRIGQKFIVRALNFALDDTVELRVRAVLEEKLQRILDEFGVDKLADVLDSEEGGVSFEDLFVQAVVSPEDAEKRATELADEIRRKAEDARDGAKLLSLTERLDPSRAQDVANHQMPYWTERLTLAHLRGEFAFGARVSKAHVGYDLRWPDGHEVTNAVFSRDEAELPGAVHLSLKDERIRGLLTQLAVFAPGQPIPAVFVPGVSDKVSGIWSLWQVSLQTGRSRRQRSIALFVSDDGRTLLPTARIVWDRLIDLPDGLVQAGSHLTGDTAAKAYEASRDAAEAQGASVFEELATGFRESTRRERRKGAHAFAGRKRAIESLGLPQVRAYRLAHLAEEERRWAEGLAANETALPELVALVMVRVAAQGASS